MLKVTHRDLIDRALAEVDTLDVDDAIALLATGRAPARAEGKQASLWIEREDGTS
mgnify:CR=1 FL=1